MKKIVLLSGGSLIAFVMLHKAKILNRIIGYLLIFSFVATIYLLVWIYKFKSPWYGPTFLPPNKYIHGPLSNDQGNNI